MKRGHRLWFNIIAAAIVVGAGLLLLFNTIQSRTGQGFQRVVVDADPPRDPWGKAIGDLNNDGFDDLIIGGHRPNKPGLWRRLFNRFGLIKYEWPVHSELVWYQNPNWEKHLVSNSHRIRTDIEVADVDGDGSNDLLVVADSGLVWFRNPDWLPSVIDTRVLHDVEIIDFDKDGDLDVVARNQRLFGHNDADQLHFYRQDNGLRWRHFQIDIPQGEGLKVADMNGDAKPDVIVNNVWYENPGVMSANDPWEAHPYGSTWQWPDVFIDAADINMDGRVDIVLSPAEEAGMRYHLAWFESPGLEGDPWREHLIDSDVEAVYHYITARDMDNDGLVDILAAEMHQGKDPDEVAVYWNEMGGEKWHKQVIATTGSHSMRVSDIDNDGDLDFFGANWTGKHQEAELWINKKKK